MIDGEWAQLRDVVTDQLAEGSPKTASVLCRLRVLSLELRKEVRALIHSLAVSADCATVDHRFSSPDPVDAELVVNAGGTLQIRNCETLSLPMARVVALVENSVGGVASARINAYISGVGAGVIPRHHDPVGNFLLQLAGRKRFRLSSPPSDAGWCAASTAHAPPPAGEEQRLELQPGDIAYLPPGVPHATDNPGPGVSVHLSLSVHVPTAQELLLAALAEKMADRSGSGFRPEGWAESVRVAAQWIERLDLADARAAFVRANPCGHRSVPMLTDRPPSRSARLRPGWSTVRALGETLVCGDFEFTTTGSEAARFAVEVCCRETTIAEAEDRAAAAGIESSEAATLIDGLLAVGAIEALEVPGRQSEC